MLSTTQIAYIRGIEMVAATWKEEDLLSPDLHFFSNSQPILVRRKLMAAVVPTC